MADYIHYDPDRILYSLSEGDLDSITNQAQPLWKDVCLVSFSVGIPTMINAIVALAGQETFSIDMSIFLNFTVGAIGIVLGVIFGIAWKRSYKGVDNLIESIKARPKIELNPTTSNVGALEEIREQVESIKSTPAKWG